MQIVVVVFVVEQQNGSRDHITGFGSAFLFLQIFIILTISQIFD